MFPFQRKKEKKPPQEVPKWFKWLFGAFMVYALISALLADDVAELTQSTAQKTDQEAALPKMPDSPDFTVLGKNSTAPFSRVDLEKGDGMAISCWDTALVRFQLFRADGTVVEDNLKADVPQAITVGKGMVVPAWERGLLAMRVGGLRDIVAQPDQAFGAEGFSHPDFTILDPVGFRIRIEDAFSPTEPDQNQGIEMKIYDDVNGVGAVAQCTDDVEVRVTAHHVTGAPLWDSPRKMHFHIGAGEVAYAIERGAMGMRVGGKRTVIAPAGSMAPVYMREKSQVNAMKNSEENLLPNDETALSTMTDGVMLLELELLDHSTTTPKDN